MKYTFPLSSSVGRDASRYVGAEVEDRASIIRLWIVVLTPIVLGVAVLVVLALAHHAAPAGGGA